MTQYDYDNITPAYVDPNLFEPKPKPTPRKPLPDAVIAAIKASAESGAPQALHVPEEAGEKAAKNLVNRIRDYADKHGGHGVRSKVDAAPDGGWNVAFKIQPKRVRNAAQESDVEKAAHAAEELHQDLDTVVEEALSEPEFSVDDEAAEAVPAEKPKRAPRGKK